MTEALVIWQMKKSMNEHEWQGFEDTKAVAGSLPVFVIAVVVFLVVVAVVVGPSSIVGFQSCVENRTMFQEGGCLSSMPGIPV